ncbi:hypothetical protein NP233_g6369 [Leucocoprinus birnbaumii]|uniref:Acyltransferase MbtK/IucB-like conserved domain-containing protein n=1 Tax=Leucocoprinus birnbaumii TaxID=56174 RepID=A0AAD5VTF1_9AGAR|nr:hypothetical protein NP233_g6369 [Leucocoprinus birnbaumii]
MTTVNYPTRRLQAIHDHTSSRPSRTKGFEELVTRLPTGERLTHFMGATGPQIRMDGKPILDYQVLNDSVTLELTSVNTEFEGTTQHLPKYNVLKVSSSEGIPIPAFWASIYALFTLYREQEQLPIILHSAINSLELASYLLDSGLGRLYPIEDRAPRVLERDVYFISRAAFWQAAGTEGYHTHSWLRDPRRPIPPVNSFTRSKKVIAQHPVRPSKPTPGQLLYQRYCTHVGQFLEIHYFDIDGVSDTVKREDGVSRHLAAFNKWHNDDRVNTAWGERGGYEKHRKYIEEVMADPHVLPSMMSWDGELMGYCEIMYTREDHVAQHYPEGIMVGDWERNVHILTGEQKFLGNGRAAIYLRCMLHYIFLSDPRTIRACGEPDWKNAGVHKAATDAGFIQEVCFDFPYKRSSLLLVTRARFFNKPLLW